MDSRFQTGIRTAYSIIAWLYVVAILFQVLLIGLNLFAAEPTRSTHVGFGHFIGIFPILLIILAFVGRLPRSAKWLAGLQFGLFVLQAEVFAAIRGSVPLLAAFHPVLAMVVFAVAVLLASRAVALARISTPAAGV